MRHSLICLCMLALPVFANAQAEQSDKNKPAALEEKQSEKTFHSDLDDAQAKIRELNGKRHVDPKEAYEAYDKFVGLVNMFSRNLTVSALEYTETALKENPSAKLYFDRAQLLMQMKRYAEAIPVYSDALKMEKDPARQAMYYSNRARAYRDSGDPAKAFLDYDEAIKLSPTTSFLYQSRASLYMRLRDYKNAGADLESFFKYNKDQNFAGMVLESNCEMIVMKDVPVKGCPTKEEFLAKKEAAKNENKEAEPQNK